MAKQPEIIEHMLERIKPNEVHQVDPYIAEMLTGIVSRNKEHIQERLPELENILRQYSVERDVDYNRYVMPYLTHYLPKNYAKVQNVLLELLRKDLLPDKMRILDIGSGPGTSAFAIANFFTHLSEAEKELGIARKRKVTVYSNEKYPKNIEIFQKLKDAYYEKNPYARKNIKLLDPLEVTITETKKTKKDFKRTDLVLLSNVLTEMEDDFEKTIVTISSLVNSEGSLAIIETADKVATNKINKAKHVLRGEEFEVYSPAGIWTPCCEFQDPLDYASRGWGRIGDCTFCCIEKPNMQCIRYPGTIGGSKNDLKYSLVIMRQDGETVFKKMPSGYSKLKGITAGRKNVRIFKQRRKTRHGETVEKKINGKDCPVYYACDGTAGREYAQLVSYIRENTRIIARADDGDVLDIKDALIQNNHEGYAQKNIIVDSDSEIKVKKNTL